MQIHSQESGQIQITHMLIDENWIFDLWVYSNNSVGIKSNGNELLKRDNWKFTWLTDWNKN